jgi:hypothetical protein
MTGKFKYTGTLLQGFDLLDVTNHMISTNKKFQATFLSQLEGILEDREEYTEIRKLYLDSSNNYLRTIIKSIFGGIEV